MQLISLDIKNYKIFKNRTFIFNDTKRDSNTCPIDSLYGKINVSLLVGENGTGKTTLMSFIANIFHNLERYHKRIQSEFSLKYLKVDKENKIVEVTIDKKNNIVYIEVTGIIERSRLLELHSQIKEDNQTCNAITYAQIEEYLPTNVITSAFSLHGEYPKVRPHNYLGDERVHVYDITDIYGENHYAMKSLSTGIFRFLLLCQSKPQLIDKYFLQPLKLEFAGKTYVRFSSSNKDDKRGSLNLSDFMKWIKDRGDDLQDDNYYEKREELVKIFHESIQLGEAFNEDDSSIDIVKYFNENQYHSILLELMIRYHEVYLNDLVFVKNGIEITLSNMSSGEKMLLIRVLSILSSIENGSLVLIEEPELHLNPVWTKQFMSIISILMRKYDSHFIIATHSHLIINCLISQNVILLNQKEMCNPKFNTLLAQESEIVGKLFNESVCRNIVEDELALLLSNGDKTSLEKIYENLGESYLRFQVFKAIYNRE